MSAESLLEKFSIGDTDRLCCRTSASGNFEDIQDYLIFFIAGNPGLISYYKPFLSRLRALLEYNSSDGARFHICGHSYKGFEISPYSEKPSQPLGLKEQIDHQEDLLAHHVKYQHDSIGKPPKVILIGHSVGAYVVLQMIQRHWEMIDKKDVEDFDLIGGILLFPTIENIAQSPMGRVAKLGLRLPGFARIVGAIAHGLSYMLPPGVLKGLVKLVTRFPDYAADTTTSLLASPMGVRQLLYLAHDEMQMIKTQNWDDEVWGATTSQGTNRRDTINWNIVTFWGKNDKWVADHTRQKIIERQGSQPPKTANERQQRKWQMESDEEGIPHDFCTTKSRTSFSDANIQQTLTNLQIAGNSYTVAGKVSLWVPGIIRRHNEAVDMYIPRASTI